jgi:UDP-N-acetylmuramyl tripeptide synthase
VETDKAEKAINKTADKVLVVIVEQGHKVTQIYLESLHPTAEEVREWMNSQITKEK